MRKLKVAYICHLSNSLIRERLNQNISWYNNFFRKILGKKEENISDFAVWNTYAIEEFKKHEDIEWHIIAPVRFVNRNRYVWIDNNVTYHLFRDQYDKLGYKILRCFLPDKFVQYKSNRRIIKRTVKDIAPDLIHVVGAENPHYSLSLMDVDDKIPTILQLQTLISDPDFQANYPILPKRYEYLCDIENKLLKKATYVGTIATKFLTIIKANHPEVKLVDTNLPLTEPVKKIPRDLEKKYTFVYFSLNISKAADYAIESFAIAHKKYPSITLNVIGGYDIAFKKQLDHRIEELKIRKNVFFEGEMVSHDDVINQIRLSKYALLPLKIDLISGTIREAMANGLPVLTSDTGEFGTQKINIDNQKALISPKGDHEAMAANMIKLMEDEELSHRLVGNSFNYMNNSKSNKDIVDHWIECYHDILSSWGTKTSN